MHEQVRFFASLSDTQLVAEVERLAVTQRSNNAALIASLAELDARKLYLGLGFPSLFSYCTERLRLSRHAAYNRIEAARTARRFPVVLDLLASGDVTMTSVALLNKYLTEANHLELLNAARNKTKGEVLGQVAEMDPRPDLNSLIVPLGDGRFRLEVTVPTEVFRDLQRLQDLLRHSIPTGDPALIVAHALSQTRAQVERRKLADVRRPRRGVGVSSTRYIPAAVRRDVWKRDGAQCAFVGTNGRCPERGFLELHHVIPIADHGPTSVENLQLRCRAHNNYEAEQYFGNGGVEQMAGLK